MNGYTWWSKFKDINDARVALEVNEDGKADDYVALGGTAKLTVTVLGGSASTDYVVQLQTSYRMIFDGPNGASTKSVTIKGQGGSASFTLYGQFAGNAKITGTCPNAAAGDATAAIVDIAVTFSKPELRPGIGAARADTVMVAASRVGGGAELTVNLATNNARASITSQASLTIPQGQNEAHSTVVVRGNSPSAADQDTRLEAEIAGVLKNSIPITVVVPAKWTNDSLGIERSAGPQLLSGTPGLNDWGVKWLINVVFTALDQFGRPLGAQWAGVQMFENPDVNPHWTLLGATSASAQVTDPVTDKLLGLPEAQARAIANGAEGGPSQRIITTVLTYKIVDGTATYNLVPNNLRVNQKKDVANVFTLINRDNQQ